MAKKQNPDSPAASPRRRSTKAPAPVPPGDNAIAPQPLSLNARTPEPSYDDIAHAAYLRYLNRGGADGSDFDDWVEAERDLRRKG